ncbi:MAG: hypothetical protein EHM61_28205 [Acidobacteria bacterium]|nr:MAG: hypothetical protein EHM61_28205 [Acidobacteriota bacterium]
MPRKGARKKGFGPNACGRLALGARPSPENQLGYVQLPRPGARFQGVEADRIAGAIPARVEIATNVAAHIFPHGEAAKG